MGHPCSHTGRGLPLLFALAPFEFPGHHGRDVFHDRTAMVVGLVVKVQPPHQHILQRLGQLPPADLHAIGGLSENDFILAGKIDALPRDAPPEARR